MDIGKYIGLDRDIEYTTDELNNIFSKFDNLNMGNFRINGFMISFLNKQNSSLIIKFINMFKDINEFESTHDDHCYSLAGNILFVIRSMCTNNKTCVYKIMDHMLEMNMNINRTAINCVETYGMEFYGPNRYNNINNYNNVTYIVNNYTVIQNVRKIINNNDIILFDITNDLQFIELILLITKCKNKNVPKFVITHKILYYYLLEKNDIYND